MTRVAMLLENNGYPMDVRVRSEAEALAQAGHEVTVCAPREPGQSRRDEVAGVKVRRFRLPETGAGPAGMVLEYLIANVQLYFAGARELLKGARVLHLHNPPETLFGVGWLARLAGRRVIFDHHDLSPELFEAKFGPGGMVKVLLAFERWTMRVAHHVLAANESHRELAMTRGGKAPEDVTVVRNGPPLASLGERRPARDGALTDPELVFLGSMESQDGVDLLPEVVDLLVREHGLAGTRLVMVGAGSRRPDLEAAFAERGLTGNVHWTGQIPHRDVPGQLADADICLDPAPPTPINNLSTMIKIAEYMAAGRPIVSFRLLETTRTAGDIPVYVDGEDAAAFAAAVAALAADGADRADRGERGAERARELTWDHSAEALLGVYAGLARTT